MPNRKGRWLLLTSKYQECDCQCNTAICMIRDNLFGAILYHYLKCWKMTQCDPKGFTITGLHFTHAVATAIYSHGAGPSFIYNIYRDISWQRGTAVKHCQSLEIASHKRPLKGDRINVTHTKTILPSVGEENKDFRHWVIPPSFWSSKVPHRFSQGCSRICAEVLQFYLRYGILKH